MICIFKDIADKYDDIMKINPDDKIPVYLIKSLIIRFGDHNVTLMAGQLAYFFLLSMFPFIIFLNALISSLKLSKEIVVGFLQDVFPVQIADLIGSYVEYVSNLQSGVGIISVGVIIALFSASKSVRALSIAINQAYSIKEKRYFIIRLLLSIIFTFALGVIVFLCLFVVSVGRQWLYRIVIMMDVPVKWLNVISIGKWVVVFTVFLIILLLVYYTIPLKRVRLKNIIPGAIVAIIANFALTYGYSIYISYFSNFSVLYGSLGVVLLLALWLYLVGVFIIMGAEINSAVEEIKYFRIKKKV
ncbi:MAG: YihY/virulence factor BrkB family protein [Bacillota bacterium]|nr:YihY/virulence factor BrkB family protein [Bacillota bacterium]